MKLILAKIGSHPTVSFAQQELFRYLKKIDPTLFLECRTYHAKDETRPGVLWIGLDGSVPSSDRDEISIQVKSGAGVITGSNPRSVLIAVYRLLQELGCRFLFPGEEGEVIPSKKLLPAELSVTLQEQAAYRHRSICIEGGNAFEHIRNIIDWIPKVGMNGYFVQFPVPGTFFKRFYSESYNPALRFPPIDDTDVMHIWSRLEEEIILRDLDYHATGHGWTCEPFGIAGSGWETTDTVPEDVRPFLAEIKGERKFFGGMPLNTNLCYSNPVVRQKMTDAIVAYCQAHPAVNYLHFWLADGSNNHCECPECQKMRPADWYVKILNELDDKLTAAGVSTKIVCLIYVDLLWEPEVEKVQNPDRFVLMFAPITRTYSSSFADLDLNKEVELSPYIRNQLTIPKSVEENVARLKRWQTQQLSGESFDFDYHLMWDHYRDPGYYECARLLHKDMVNLDKIGLDGMVSCQINRCAFPTGLPMYAMAKGLWDKNSRFEDICTEYFTAAYGEEARQVETFFATLSRLFEPRYLRNDIPRDPQAKMESLAQAKDYIADFTRQFILPNAHRGFLWKNLEYHAEYCQVYADSFIAQLQTDDIEERYKARDPLMECVFRIEEKVPSLLDSYVYYRIWGGFGNL